jgi:ATP-dependent Lon protease
MESGVRSLERRLAQICRWAALRLAGPTDGTNVAAPIDEEKKEADRLAEVALAECGPDKEGRVCVDAQHLAHIVGSELFEPDLAERLSIGVSMGLGVTTNGGQLLFVEATRSNGSGRLTVTGQLGEVMLESVKIAMSLLRSKIYYASLAANGEASPVVMVGPSAAVAADTGATGGPATPLPAADPPPAELSGKFQEVFQHLLAHADPTKDPFGQDDIHVHFPAGAIPKDGPSAGVTTTLALASLLLNRPVRSDTAVTGEVTLRGHVLPVGGTRDKVLAARRAGVRHVLLPYGNQRHIKDDLSDEALGDVELHFVKHIDEALAWAFAENVKPSTLVAYEPASTSPNPGEAPLSKL